MVEEETTWRTSGGTLIAGPTKMNVLDPVDADLCCREGAEAVNTAQPKPELLAACETKTEIVSTDKDSGATWIRMQGQE